MLRLAILSSLVISVFSLDALEKNFDIVSRPTLSNIKCDKIVEDLPGCYECFLCDESKIGVKKRRGATIYNLTLVDKDCDATQLCCFSQKELIYREVDSGCGVSHPDGYPFKVRNRLREVLEGEYPWRAWVYSKEDLNRPLCAATYINYEDAALLAPADCVRNVQPELLVVRFTKHGDDHYVRRVAVHSEFNTDTHENDIALISLRMRNFPRWAAPACLPRVQLPFGSACVGVSDDDNYINFVVPKQSLCNETDPELPNSLMCAVAPPRDYKQEYGGGLFCLNDDEKKPTYTLYGIMLARSGDAVSLYSNITNYRSWIEDKITGSNPPQWNSPI